MRIPKVEIRQRYAVPTFLLMIIFSNVTFAITGNTKDDFISKVLPEIKKAKDDVGGIAGKIPVSLVLAQAIHESGWGNSRFAKHKKNLFGIKRGKDYAKFVNIEGGIKYYLQTLSTDDAYKGFRKHLGSGSLTLLKHLGDYAEDPEYATKLARIINVNHLLYFDSWF